MVAADKLRALEFAEEAVDPLRGVDFSLGALVGHQVEKLLAVVLACADDLVRLVDEEAAFELFNSWVLSHDTLDLLVLSLNQVYGSFACHSLCTLHSLERLV